MSERMRSEVAKRVGERRVVVLPDGVDLGVFKPMDKRSARAALGEADDTAPWVLFSSVVADNPVKRRELARTAVLVARRTMRQIRLIEMTNVAHDRVPLYVNAADVILLTSTHEGWPNIIKEGLACNVPFVSTDVSDLREVAGRAPGCIVVDEASASALGNAILETLSAGPCIGLRTIASEMDMGVTARQLVRWYERIAGEPWWRVRRPKSGQGP